MNFERLFEVYFRQPALAILIARQAHRTGTLATLYFADAVLVVQTAGVFGAADAVGEERVLFARILVAMQANPLSMRCGAPLVAEAARILRAPALTVQDALLVIEHGPPLLADFRALLRNSIVLGFALNAEPIVRACAAFALPEMQLEPMLAPPAPEVPEWLTLSRQAASSADPQASIDLRCRALTAASTAPVEARVRLLMELIFALQTAEPRVLREALVCVAASVEQLAREPQLGSTLAPATALALALATNLPDADVYLELRLATVAETMVRDASSVDALAALATTAARSFARGNQTQRGLSLLNSLASRATKNEARIDAAATRLAVEFGTQGFEPVQELITLLEQSSDISPDQRLIALQTIVTSYPRGRPGLDPYVDALVGLARTTSGAKGALIRLTVALKLFDKKDVAAKLVADIDANTLIRSIHELPSSLRPRIEQIILESTLWLESLRTGDASARPAWIVAVEQGRHAEAGALLDAQQDAYRKAGLLSIADDSLASAGVAFRRAGQREESLDRLSRAITSFEARSLDVSSAAIAASWYANWAFRYANAAIAAIDSAELTRALDWCERSRTRLTSQRLGPRTEAPSGVTNDEWMRYRAAWRVAASRSSNDTLSERGTVDLQAQRKVDALRETLVSRGVARAALAPIDAPPRVDALLSSVRRAAVATVALYSVRAADSLRFIAIDRLGARALRFDEAQGRSLVEACTAYLDALVRVEPSRRAKTTEQRLPLLLRAVGSTMYALVEEALGSGAEPRRLLWIPHGPLAAIPIEACSGESGRSVIDLASVIVAPSLASVAQHLESPAIVGRGVGVLRGRDAGKATTTGGEHCARILDANAGPDVLVNDARALVDASHGRGVIHLSCHGVFLPENPIESFIELGVDCTLAQLLDQQEFAGPVLALLRSCDSATISQLDSNDALGLPSILRALGATAVIGAQWPVSALASAAFLAALCEGLSRGVATPEATRDAMLWVRSATGRQIIDRLDAIGHPEATRAREAVAALPELLDDAMLSRPISWAAYTHWGAPTVVQ